MDNRSYKTKLRFNILTTIIYIFGIILLLQLFNLQIINGEKYRQESSAKLAREKIIEAPRGEFSDRNGTVLVTNTMGFDLILYKTKSDTDSFNNTLLNIVNVLEKNGENYSDTLPISLNPIKFTFENDENKSKEKEWKKRNRLDENLSAEECLNKLKDKYKINKNDINEIRKIAGLRYDIAQTGYSTIKAYTVCKNVSRQTILEVEERNTEFAGVDVVAQPVRNYVKGNLASHIIGYTGKITGDELKQKKDEGYTANDSIGRAGIEAVLEEYLRGEKGIKQIDMSISGVTSGEYNIKDSKEGSDVVLTIDASLQEVAQKALEANIKKIREGRIWQKIRCRRWSSSCNGCKNRRSISNGKLSRLQSTRLYKWNKYRKL